MQSQIRRLPLLPVNAKTHDRRVHDHLQKRAFRPGKEIARAGFYSRDLVSDTGRRVQHLDTTSSSACAEVAVQRVRLRPHPVRRLWTPRNLLHLRRRRPPHQSGRALLHRLPPRTEPVRPGIGFVRTSGTPS